MAIGGWWYVGVGRKLTVSAEAINLGSLTPGSIHAVAAIECWEVGLLLYAVAVVQWYRQENVVWGWLAGSNRNPW